MYNINLAGNFVVQRANYHEVPAFAELCWSYGLTPSYQILQDWGTYENFKDQCVHFADNEHYKDFCRIFQDTSWQTGKIYLNAIYEYIKT